MPPWLAAALAEWNELKASSDNTGVTLTSALAARSHRPGGCDRAGALS